MTENVLQLGPEILGIVAGIVVLLLFGVAVALPHRPRALPGSSGQRTAEGESEHKEIRPDGYIDTFGKEISEAGGALPPVLRLALPGVALWWLIYLIVNWKPR